MTRVHRSGWTAVAASLAAALCFSGCGTPGAPLPPSLNLPDRVADLAASRTGNAVSLTWTMPRKNTDKLLLKGEFAVRLCRREAAGPCVPVGGDLLLPPASAGAFTETLPSALASGEPRALSYLVEVKNRNGRSAGLSNQASVVAGLAPSPVEDLAAEVRKEGVVLHWKPENATASAAVRLHRKLIAPAAAKPSPKASQGPLAAPAEPVQQKLLVESEARSGRALDKSIRFGQTYEYRAQRLLRVQVEGKTVELAGELSAPVRVEAIDVFPPAVPAGLAAVASMGETAAEVFIDLSWQPDTEADLAGYFVYRREAEGDWHRISPRLPFPAPAFHDTDVRPGHTYRYAVSAVDLGGHESLRSAEAGETVPER
jgi:hypothetical protein